MRPRSQPEVAAWLDKAERDLLMARRATDGEPELYDQACFHSQHQQAAEKVLKALLTAADLPVPRTHDLVVLLHLVEDLLDISGLLEPASRLTKFSTSPRYPSFLASETAQDAEMAIGIARDIIAQVVGEIPT